MDTIESTTPNLSIFNSHKIRVYLLRLKQETYALKRRHSRVYQHVFNENAQI